MKEFDLVYKTIDEVYKLLPFNGYTRLFTDCCGIYYPDRDKKHHGHKYVMWTTEYKPGVLYVSTHKLGI